jgi:hypothetical protein
MYDTSLQILMLQTRMQETDQQYSVISNVMKSRSDAAKSVIRNLK